MNDRQKEILQSQLNDEKALLKSLEAMYKDALAEINSKIELLMARQDADLQHVIYQVQYQQALKTQIQAILETLQANEFESMSEYLAKSYEEGFLGTMYDLQGQGIPLVFPIDQAQVLEAIQTETNLSTTLYGAMGKDIKDLQKKIAGEISRGLATGMMYSEMARNIASWARIPKNNAMRIARTEAHRIQCKAAYDAQWKAKSKGADVVKQWDSTLDGKTRDSHRAIDGEIKELDETFSNGLEYPGDPSGAAAEVINCRCALLQRARWALGNNYTKWSEDAPVEISDDGTTQFVKIDANSFNEFKGYYRDITGQMTMNMATSGSQRVRLSAQKINSPINTRNHAEGKPSAITQFGVELSKGQKALLDKLKEYDSSCVVGKTEVSMTDLAALTAKTGDEFALFTKGNNRLVIRGNKNSVNVDIDKAKELAQNGYRWSGHTHPGYDYNSMIASDGDYAILKAFKQKRSVTYNSLGQHLVYEVE